MDGVFYGPRKPKALLVVVASGRVLFHPSNKLIHPALKEFLAVRADVAALVKQSILDLDKNFGLSQCRHIQRCEDIAQMLLRHTRTGGTG